MTGDQLVAQVKKMQREFYSLPAMVKRLRFPRLLADFASWNVCLTQRKMAFHSDVMNEFSEF
jgi:hypothetical protein